MDRCIQHSSYNKRIGGLRNMLPLELLGFLSGGALIFFSSRLSLLLDILFFGSLSVALRGLLLR
ncbi:hypothetical protein BDB00DRAFT_832870 [Zychaea mexicana]|uniref:uncharacterized protein n=1 Tax=Zychaea mexicana TaxID=64656 RepID=UPI0022FEE6D4|nr:uncharacterized protein BDB00DRAFT_832870 [Zychaea mexicana]KAI9491404.1 hypothetical protein BDB00DRAFT_832870 [Zychaea mexicana]